MYKYARSNILLRMFSYCSIDEKLFFKQLFHFFVLFPFVDVCKKTSLITGTGV